MQNYACFYIADPSLLGSKLFESIPAIRSYEGLSADGLATGARLDIGVAQIQMNFMPPDEIEEHLKGFVGYIHSVCDDEERLIYTLGRVNSVRFVVGCVIEPGFDEQARVQAFLLDLNQRLNGLLFVFDSVVDYDGQPLVGPLAAASQGA